MNKKNLLVTATAVTLAATMMFGGTIAYLTDSTDEVVNEFTTNQNDVDLQETTGNDYDIVPGTSQDKDPTVTATYTLDSYVFVVVTDNTQGLVTYEINEGWTKLDVETEEGVSVYYQLVQYNADEAEDGVCISVLTVLKDNVVSYDSSLTNEDLADAENITLTFQAYVIQAASFESVDAAWAALNGDEVEEEEVYIPDHNIIEQLNGDYD